ncbi:hypothetical protein HMPREF1249_1376 [Jonquetella sp. BV3C21]|nr:hypothetical protein HMPREF1249_1376 [Jonquetella sp. BV3C21]
MLFGGTGATVNWGEDAGRLNFQPSRVLSLFSTKRKGGGNFLRQKKTPQGRALERSDRSSCRPV